MPHRLLPPFMNNKGTYTLSLGNFCRWLAGQAEELGVEIFPGFPASEILFNDEGAVKGVATGDLGIARDGSHRPDYQPGMELHARYTFFAEGARGHLTKRLTEIFGLRDESGPQIFGLGIKELWEVPAEKHKPGRVIHTQGWPLTDAWGGGFLYHQENGQVALGFVVALDYSNPYLSPFEEMQRWKTHPAIRAEIEGGRRAVLRRAGDQRGRAAGHSQAGVPGRRADRLLGGLPQRAADQGHAHRDEVGDAGGRGGVRGDRRRPLGRRARGYPTARRQELDHQGAEAGPQRPAGGRAIGAARSERSMPGSTCGSASSASACRGR